jgi:radical SAM/Cys-rich protein
MSNDFEKRIAAKSTEGLHSVGISTIQVNVGLVCNQECRHCHVAASPKRKESMNWQTMVKVIGIARGIGCKRVEITGGAPELNPYFKSFVGLLRDEGITVQLRSNLTVMTEPGMEEIPVFLKEQRVELVGSLPCYLEENVNAQRGEGTYKKSMQALRELNELGYGTSPDLPLDLVYNPVGAHLPPEQASLEVDYRRELGSRFGVVFTKLLTITNMPIGRFLTDLRREKKADAYMSTLVNAFNPAALEGLMCRYQISIDWQGRLYDCDFNLALGLCVNHGAPDHIDRFDATQLVERRIVTGDHCFGCTAGCGSSCGGALL